MYYPSMAIIHILYHLIWYKYIVIQFENFLLLYKVTCFTVLQYFWKNKRYILL